MTNDVMEFLVLLAKTLLLRPYVFVFLAAFLFAAGRLLGWPRAWAMFAVTWLTAFISEFSSTRIGIPFGRYDYTGITVGDELYLSNVPVMDTLSFTFLLFASYAMALWFLLPVENPTDNPTDGPPRAFRFDLSLRTSWPVLILTVMFYVLIDVVIDPVALRGGRWFLGQIYGYPDPGLYFGVPMANFFGWAVVGTISMLGYVAADRRLGPPPESASTVVSNQVLIGCALYYGVLVFNLMMTFWIGEDLLGLAGVLMYCPITLLFVLRYFGRLPLPAQRSLIKGQ